MAVHILAFLARSTLQRVTSDFIADSVGTNPVVVRRLLGELKSAGLVTSQQGPEGGFALLKAPLDISLLDVYRAVQTADARLFGIHAHPRPQCVVGGAIQSVLEDEFQTVQIAMEAALCRLTLETVLGDIARVQQARSS